MKNKYYAGLSLIELMITLVLSSFLILGITQIYLKNKSDYIFSNHQIRNNDTARFISMSFDEEVGRSGYRRLASRSYEEVFKKIGFFSEGETIKGLSESAFAVRYQFAHAAQETCQPLSFPTDDLLPGKGDLVAPAIVIFRFNKDARTLTCFAINEENAQAAIENYDPAVGNNKETNFISNISGIKFLYAVGHKNDAARKVLEYKEFKDLTENDQIRGIQYAVLLGEKSTNAVSDDSRVLSLFYGKAPQDKGVYNLITGMSIARNILP